MSAVVALGVAAALASLGCAHPAAAPGAASVAGPAQHATVPLEAITGDWVLLGWPTELRVSNGGAIVYAADERHLSLHRYRVAGARGPVVDLDDAEEEILGGRRKPTPLFTRRAHFLVVSDAVGLFIPPDRPSVLAFRAGPVPSSMVGRYALAKAIDDVDVLEVEARAVRMASAKENARDYLPILSASEHSDAAASVVLVHGTQRGLAQFFAAAGGKPQIEFGNEDRVVGPVDVHFTPAVPAVASSPAKGEAGASVALPFSGAYRIEDLGGFLSGRVQIEGDRWQVAISNGTTDFTATASVVGQIGARLSHVHLDLGPLKGVWHLDLRPIDGGGGALLVSASGGRDRNYARRMGLMFRADAVPAWAPSVGLEKDMAMLCAELDALSVPARSEQIEAAFSRVGGRATSENMRKLCTSVIGVDPSMRLNMLRHVLRDMGGAIPSCASADKLGDKLGHIEPTRSSQTETSP